MGKAKRILKLFLGFPITLISILFILKILYDSRDTILASVTEIDSLIFLLGLSLFALFFYLKAFIWSRLLEKSGYKIDRRSAIYYYAVSDIRRYIPGSIFSFISRISTIESVVPKKETLKLIGIEAILMTISSLIVSLPALCFLVFNTTNIQINIIFAFLTALAFTAFIYFVLLKKSFKVLFLYFDEFLLFIFSWMVFGIASFLVAISFTFINPDNTLFIISFFTLSWLIGFLSFVTPMGLGVRELAITGSLSLFLPVAFASVIALLTRIGMILGEIFYLFLVRVFFKLKNNSPFLRLNTNQLVLAAAVVIYSIYFIYFTLLRHAAFMSARFDLGNMAQTVWNTSRGNFLQLTNPDGIEQISRLAVHTDVILALLSPFYFIWSDPRMLLIIQTIVISCGAFFVYGIGKLILKKEKIPLVFALSYLLNFWIHEQNIFDFHSVSLATTFLLAAFYFVLKKRYVFFSIFLILSLLTKENLFLVAFIFGIYFFFVEKKKVPGILLSIFSLAAFYGIIKFLIPASRGTGHFALKYYSYIGDSSEGFIRNLLLKPELMINQVSNFQTLEYLHKLFLPTGYLSLLSPFYLLFALPDMAISVLSSNTNLHSHEYHYGAVIVPFIYISSIYGVKKLMLKFGSYGEKLVFYYLIVATVLSLYCYSPLPGMKRADVSPFKSIDHQKIKEYLSIIPDKASVAASNKIGAHLSHRNQIYVVPYGIEIADYIVLYNENEKITSSVNLVKYEIAVEYKTLFIFKRKDITSFQDYNL